jgi:hypothetical protein
VYNTWWEPRPLLARRSRHDIQEIHGSDGEKKPESKLARKKQSHMQKVVTLWMLWSSQNKTNAGESRAPKIMVGLILKHYMDTQQLTESNTNLNIAQSKWRRPPLEFLKINVDGSYVEANRIGGLGFHC